MILVERMEPENIHAAIRDLLAEECFEDAFHFCDLAEADDYEIYNPPIQIPLTEEAKQRIAVESKPAPQDRERED